MNTNFLDSLSRARRMSRGGRWITKKGRHIYVGGHSRYHQAVLPTSSPKSSLSGIHKVRDFPNGQYLIRYQLPFQRAFTDRMKSAVVESVRKRFGDAWAASASAVLDQVIQRVLPGATWTTEGEVLVGPNGVKGRASAEFTMDPLAAAAEVKLPDGSHAPEFYVSASLRYDGNLKTGRLDVTNVRVACGVRADLPGVQTDVSVSAEPSAGSAQAGLMRLP